MKKGLAVMLAAAMAVSGCGGKKEPKKQRTPTARVLQEKPESERLLERIRKMEQELQLLSEKSIEDESFVEEYNAVREKYSATIQIIQQKNIPYDPVECLSVKELRSNAIKNELASAFGLAKDALSAMPNLEKDDANTYLDKIVDYEELRKEYVEAVVKLRKNRVTAPFPILPEIPRWKYDIATSIEVKVPASFDERRGKLSFAHFREKRALFVQEAGCERVCIGGTPDALTVNALQYSDENGSKGQMVYTVEYRITKEQWQEIETALWKQVLSRGNNEMPADISFLSHFFVSKEDHFDFVLSRTGVGTHHELFSLFEMDHEYNISSTGKSVTFTAPDYTRTLLFKQGKERGSVEEIKTDALGIKHRQEWYLNPVTVERMQRQSHELAQELSRVYEAQRKLLELSKRESSAMLPGGLATMVQANTESEYKRDLWATLEAFAEHHHADTQAFVLRQQKEAVEEKIKNGY